MICQEPIPDTRYPIPDTLPYPRDEGLAGILSAIPSILVGMDTDEVVTQWNAAAVKAFGIPREQAIGRPFIDAPIQWDWELIVDDIEKSRDSDAQLRFEDVRFVRPSGEEGFLGITINPMRNELGFRTGLLLLAADITDRKLLQSQLAQAQRMESIGQLAAGIAHEINTPTQYIGDNTRFLQESFEDLKKLLARYDEAFAAHQSPLTAQLSALNEEADLEYLLDEIPRAISQSLEGIERVSKIVQAMKEFSHPGAEEKVAVDINRAIESTITVARNEWKYVAELQCDFDPDLPLVPCLPGDFNQVVLNLLVNAAHAISEKHGGSAEKGLIRVSTRLEGGWAEVRFEDTGGGIPPSIRAKIFNPFFTTKEVGKGTGQGLAIAHSIVVDKHHGLIRFDSEEGIGTTFIIRLPLEI